MGVAAVEILGDEPVFRSVGGQVGIQIINGNLPALKPDLVVFPDADVDLPSFDLHGDLHGQLLHESSRIEVGVGLFLESHGIDVLDEISPFVEEGYGHEGNAQVGCGLDVIPGQNSEATAVRGNVLVETHFHAEIGDFHRPSLYSVSYDWSSGTQDD